MNEPDTVRARLLDDGTVVQVLPDGSTRPFKSRTNWARLDAMTEEEIEANALSDPDNPPITDEELARMHRVPDAGAIRRRLGLTQEAFADRFRLPLDELRDWERRASFPTGAARTLLRVIDRDPDAVLRALAEQPVLERSAD
jgi:putative transcriptional regulator